MRALRRLLRYVRQETGALAVAYACMLLLALSTAFLAFLSGPALRFVFSGDVHGLLRSSNGTPRTIWRVLPPGWVARLEQLTPDVNIWVVPILLIIVSTLKALAQTGQFYLLGRTSQRILLRLRQDVFAALP